MKNISVAVPDGTQVIAITVVYRDSKTWEQMVCHDVICDGDHRNIFVGDKTWYVPSRLEEEVSA